MGLKAGGLLQSMETFNTLFGLKLAHTLFSAAEQVSLTLQKKDITLQDAFCAVNATTELADKYTIGEPVLPRYRRRPARYDSGSEPHQYPTPKAYYRHLYYEACDLISNELTDRFDDQHVPSVLAIENILLKASNGNEYHEELTLLQGSCYKNDIDWSDLGRHLFYKILSKKLLHVSRKLLPFKQSVMQ